MIVGFALAAYAVVGNDAIQTLGTFLSSNSDKKWWVLWLYIGSIMLVVLAYGWLSYDGDVSYGRLSKIAEPAEFKWWHLLPPITLLIITQLGIPVSTTFLIISVFDNKAITPMLYKSGLGYIVAFVVAIVVYFFITQKLEKRFFNSEISDKEERIWLLLQWASTGFLWSQWLIQDLANIYVYLPRELPVTYLIGSVFILLLMLAIILYIRGGEIQKVVTSKSNTTDIRSATIIDFIFGLILFFFKNLSDIPMSTTWVFIGLLAGREFMISYLLKVRSKTEVTGLILKDMGKVFAGLVVSLALVYIIGLLR